MLSSPLPFNNHVCLILSVDDSSAEGSDESTVGRSYVKKKLEHGLTRIWQVGSALVRVFGPPFVLRSFISFMSSPPTSHPLPLPPGRPIESESLFAGNRHVQLQVRRLHCGAGCYQQVGTHFLISANWIGLHRAAGWCPPSLLLHEKLPQNEKGGMGNQWGRLFLNEKGRCGHAY